MKHKLITIFLFFVSLCFAQKTNNDLENKVNNIEAKYLKNIDSLQRELLFFKMKEDHYTTALEVQAGHYEHTTTWAINNLTIGLTIILTIISLLGWTWFKSQFNEIEKKIKNSEEKLNEDLKKRKNEINDLKIDISRDFEKQKSEIIQNIAIANATAAVHFEDKEMIIVAYDFYLKSINAYLNLDNFVEVNEGIIRCIQLINDFTPTDEDLRRNSWFLNSSDSFLSNLVGNEDTDISNNAFELLKIHKEKFSVPLIPKKV